MPSKSSPTTRKKKNLAQPREAILEVATQLFSERGYEATKMRDIAKAVGLLPGSLYAHIESKETLLLEIVEAAIDRLYTIVEAIAMSTEPADVRMRAAIKAHVAEAARNPDRTVAANHQWRYLTGADRARVVERRRQYEELFTKMMEDGVASGVFTQRVDSRVAVLGILGALNWTAEWYSPSGPATAEEIGGKLADSLLLGVLAASQSDAAP